jgi:ATP-dependent Clp protease adaptor protein ClpS
VETRAVNLYLVFGAGFGNDVSHRFVVLVLKAEFRMSEDQALRVMMTAHRRGACVVAVYTKDVAEAKATSATDAGRREGYPLLFTTEPEE